MLSALQHLWNSSLPTSPKAKQAAALAGDFLVAMVLFIITFPVFEPDYVIGLDSSYFWALNYLFEHDFSTLKTLVYPYGPLTFLKYGLVIGHNFEYSLIFFFLIKIWYTFFILQLAGIYGKSKVVAAFLIALTGLFNLFIVDYYLISISLLHAFRFLTNGGKWHIIASTIISAVSLSVKTSIGISCFSVLFMTILIYGYSQRQWKQLSIVSGLITGTASVVLLLIYQDAESIMMAISNTLRLASSYSSALSLFPDNNWLFLSIFLGSFFIPILFSKTKDIKTAFILFIFPLFATWKHSMSREDFFHNLILLLFFCFYWSVFFIISKKDKLILWSALIGGSAFLLNMTRLPDYRPFSLEISGVHYFRKTILNFSAFKADFMQRSEKAVAGNRLPPEVLKFVGIESIDSYPFELSYFSANPELNWKVRRTLQSGSFSRWLDEVNAADFNRENGPEYLLFHYVPVEDCGKFGSIDNRYLLNDNPLTIYNIFNNYSTTYVCDQYLILRKNRQNNFRDSRIGPLKSGAWNTWIDLPAEPEYLQRIRLFSSRNMAGKILGFLYKTEEYLVDYQTKSNKIITKRLIPENAQDGIWVNPFLRDPKDSSANEMIDRIRFRCTYPAMNESGFSFQTESIPYVPKDLPLPFEAYFKTK